MAEIIENEGIVTFHHHGISPWEIEVIYDTLRRSFEVDEKQIEVENTEYVSIIEVRFPIPYDESFFATFTMESWFKMKGILKDIKRRRGRKLIKIILMFAGIREDEIPAVAFSLPSKGDRQFEMSLEKIEYIVDIVPMQIKSFPEKIDQIWYSYDESRYKWNLFKVKSNNDTNYILRNNEWVVQRG